MFDGKTKAICWTTQALFTHTLDRLRLEEIGWGVEERRGDEVKGKRLCGDCDKRKVVT